MLRLLAPLLLAAFATACQATGMGWIRSSADPLQKASFGFVYDGTTQTFSGSYHDRAAGVRLKGTGVMKAGPPPAGMKVRGGCLLGAPTYESQDPARPGTGVLDLVACDLDGGGPGDGDFIIIFVSSGPFTGYFNEGSPSGNITVSSP